jgi:hypothetical protein
MLTKETWNWMKCGRFIKQDQNGNDDPEIKNS